jgi:photosystem II stability/assembly factor-like uncharacterized protein
VLIVVACSDDTQEPPLLLTNQQATNQPGWHWSNPHPQGNDLNDVDFLDKLNGFAVGMLGAIVRTQDGGINWELQKSGTMDNLFGVAANGARGAVAVGANGTILRTINRGATWERRQSGVRAGLLDVDFADANHGIAVGDNVILRTSDGGDTWASFDCKCNSGLRRVSMADANTAFAVGSDWLYSTLDGGATWTTHWMGFNGPGHWLYDVSLTDAQTATMVGESGLIMRTTDGGNTWTYQDAETQAILRSVSFADATHGVIVGEPTNHEPVVLRTSDGGAHWMHDVSDFTIDGVPSRLNAVSMLDANAGAAVGMAGNIILTTDGGMTWAGRTHELTPVLFSVSFASARDGIAVGVSAILRTRDGGVSWKLQPEDGSVLRGVTHYGTNGVIAVGKELGSPGGLIMRSTDAGASWTSNSIGANGLNAVDFADGSFGIAVGYAGTVLRTVDGGATWSSQDSGTSMPLNDVSLPNTTTGIAVGQYTTIVRTTDGGITWQVQHPVDVYAHLVAVDLLASGVGFIVGNSFSSIVSNAILRTTDGGLSWISQESDSNEELLDVVCVDSESAVILTAGRCLITIDGGAHWSPSDASIATARMHAIALSSRRSVTVAGELGAILQNHHIVP